MEVQVTEYGQSWFRQQGRLTNTLSAEEAGRRLAKGKRIAVCLPSRDGMTVWAEHDPSLGYLHVGIGGFPDDPRNSCDLRFERTEGGVGLAEIAVFSNVPDPAYGERAFWSQFIHVRPKHGRRAMLDIAGAPGRFIKTMTGCPLLEELAGVEFALPGLDGYEELVRPDLVLRAMLPRESFHPSLPDVREVRPQDHPSEGRGWRRKALAEGQGAGPSCGVSMDSSGFIRP